MITIVGSSTTSSPLETRSSATQRVKNYLWDTNLACLSFKQLSFIARYVLFFSFWFSVKSRSLFTSRFCYFNVTVDATSTRVAGPVLYSSRILLGLWLISSSVLLVTLKKLAEWLRLTSSLDII